jgi:hypothetical protein
MRTQSGINSKCLQRVYQSFFFCPVWTLEQGGSAALSHLVTMVHYVTQSMMPPVASTSF